MPSGTPNKTGVGQSIGKTGKATIDKQGHTSSGQFGSDPNKTAVAGRNVRDLSPS